ncbi:MAG TPA: rod shape-determining protein MreD [Candidatus Methylomirabilis sp.]
MKAILVFLSFLALIVLQVRLLPHFAIGDIKPDLFLFSVCCLSLRSGEAKGAIIGFGLGLLEDCLSISPVGMRAFGFSLVGFLSGYARRELLLDSLLAQTLLLFFAGLLSGSATLFALNFFLIPRPIGYTFMRLILPESLLTALGGFLLLIIFPRWKDLRTEPYGPL